MSSSTSLTLPALYLRTLNNILPFLSDEISFTPASSQAALSSSLSDLNLISRMISSVGLFSDNEELEDLGDQEMVFMSVGWVRGEVEGRIGTNGIKARIGVLEKSQASYESFLHLLESYNFPLLPNQSGSSSSTNAKDPAARREAKIKQYRMEKELKEAVTANLPKVSISSTPLPALIALLSPLSSASNTTTVNSEPSTSTSSSSLRTTTLSLLRLLHTLSSSSLHSISQELDLLKEASKNAHIEEDVVEERERQKVEQEGTGRQRGGDEDGMWRLDKAVKLGRGAAPSELMDGQGRPTQPFTILPSTGLQNLSDRARLQTEVFRSGHRLPTMTIDEYLQEEERRGNVITGGGPAQDAQLTTSEQLALDAEQDGSSFADRREEEQRQKDEKWARYTDEHKKGEGNTMNRG